MVSVPIKYYISSKACKQINTPVAPGFPIVFSLHSPTTSLTMQYDFAAQEPQALGRGSRQPQPTARIETYSKCYLFQSSFGWIADGKFRCRASQVGSKSTATSTAPGLDSTASSSPTSTGRTGRCRSVCPEHKLSFDFDPSYCASATVSAGSSRSSPVFTDPSNSFGLNACCCQQQRRGVERKLRSGSTGTRYGLQHGEFRLFGIYETYL